MTTFTPTTGPRARAPGMPRPWRRPDGILAVPAAHRSAGPWARAARRLAQNRLALTSAGFLALMCATAYGVPLRLIDGARVSLSVGVIAVGIGAAFGGAIGLLGGYFGGRVDGVLMRLIDLKLAFPGILAALVIVTVLGGGLDKAMVAVGIGALPRYARVVRASVMANKHEVFVEAARSLGASHGRIMFGHIVPHVLGPLITLATLGLATAILATASLSFLGLGAQPPTAEWGLMLSESRKYLRIAWWLAVFPGASIMLSVLAINVLGDGVRDALDPRLSIGVD